MQKIIFSILAFAFAISVNAQTLDRSTRPKPGPAPEIKIGEYKSFTLDNGMKVFVVENHKLPIVSVDIQLDIYPALENEKSGYRDMMSDLLLDGTKTRSKDKLNEEIDYIGANISASDNEISASGLTKHINKLMDLMSDIAINTDIKQTELDKTVKQTLSALEAQKNQPDAMLANVSAVMNYGTQFPYGQVTTEQTVKNIKLEDCRSYYSTYFRPNVAYMAIVGDVTVDQVKPLIEKYFGKWQKADVPVTNYSHPTAPPATKVAFAGRDGAVQSVINVTYPVDLKPGTPDVIKARVATSILGGGSQGRLFLNLREKHGWTYGSYASIKDNELIGSFTAFAKCRNLVSDSSVGEILNEMHRMRDEKVSREDLQNCINYMSGSFALGLEDPSRIAQFAINIERYHMPKDYYRNYLKDLSAVTVDDVQEIAKKYIDPDHANIVVVGSKEQVSKSLAKFAGSGKVDFYDNYGNPVKETEMTAVPSNITADLIMKNYIKAIGGQKAVEGIKDIKTVSTSEIQGMPITITEMKKAPNKWKQTLDVNMQGQKMTVQKQVFDGTKGYAEQQGQKKNLEGDDLDEAKTEGDIYLDLHPEKYGIKRVVKGMEQVNGSNAYVVEATNAKGKKSTEYYDVKSGLLVKKVQTSEAGSETSEFSDYKEVPGSNGYKMAYTIKINAGPQTFTATVQTVDVNKGIADTEFN
jgi:predicted Zn-dependent peptidase